MRRHSSREVSHDRPLSVTAREVPRSAPRGQAHRRAVRESPRCTVAGQGCGGTARGRASGSSGHRWGKPGCVVAGQPEAKPEAAPSRTDRWKSERVALPREAKIKALMADGAWRTIHEIGNGIGEHEIRIRMPSPGSAARPEEFDVERRALHGQALGALGVPVVRRWSNDQPIPHHHRRRYRRACGRWTLAACIVACRRRRTGASATTASMGADRAGEDAEEYVAKWWMCSARCGVLRDDGTLWLNLGIVTRARGALNLATLRRRGTGRTRYAGARQMAAAARGWGQGSLKRTPGLKQKRTSA